MYFTNPFQPLNWYLASLCALVLFEVALPAAAEDFDPNRLNLAKVYMEEGQEHFLAGRYNDAAIAFMKAYSVVPFSAFLFNTAVSYEKMGKWHHAAEFFERYLDSEPEASDREKVLLRIQELRAKPKGPEGPVEKIEPASPPLLISIEPVEAAGTGTPSEGREGEAEPTEKASAAEEMKSLISVTTNPSGAFVIVRAYPETEVARGPSPLTETIEQGKYLVTVTHPKYKRVDTTVDVKGGKVYVVVVEMSQGVFLGYLNIRTDRPGAKVFLGDRASGSVGKTPWGKPLPAGKHTVWIEKAGFKPEKREVEVPVGEEVTLNLQLQRVPYGVLSVKTNVPTSLLFIEGQGILQAPFAEQLDPGTYSVVAKAKGMKKAKAQVSIKEGMETTLLVRFNPKPKKTHAWVSFGLSAAMVAGGGVLAHFARELHDEMERDANLGYLTTDDPRKTKGLLLSVGADSMFLLAGIMGVLGVYYLFRDNLPDSETMVKGPADMSEVEE